MSSRSQSDAIGVVLLTLIVTVTVTASGGIALTEWQSDIGDEPLADIESTMTDNTVTLEHTGGSELNASNVVVQTDNGDGTYSLAEFDGLDETFTGGMRIEKNGLETRAGGVRLRVIHKPSQTVLHDERHDLGFQFLIGGKSGSVFMIPNTPVGYSAPEDAAVTVIDESEDSVLTVDKPNTNVTGLVTGGSATVEANDYTNLKTVDVQVIEPDQLSVRTHSLVSTDSETFEATGELTELGALDEADLYFRYRKQQPVTFNGDPADNSDDIIADGQFLTGPDGYTHSTTGYVHDNTPLAPGTNRTYEFIGDDRPQYNDNNLYVTFRDREWTEVGTFRSGDDAIEEVPYSRFYLGDNFPNNESFEVRVEYTADGSTMNVYVQGTLTDSVSGLEAYDELYFSSYQDIAQFIDPEYRLRMITAPTLGEPQTTLVEPGVEAPTNFTGEISGSTPGELYFVEAYAEREISNAHITGSGAPLAAETEELVATGESTNVTAESARLHGDLINSLGDTELSFVVMRTDTGSVVTGETVDTGVDAPRSFNATVTGLRPETNYTYYARAEDTDSLGDAATNTGKNETFTTDVPLVRTLDANATGGETATVTGELVDLGGLEEMDLRVRYRKQQPVTFNGDPTDNSDDIIADGQFLTGPDGYTHSTIGYVHDNTPLAPGTNRTYEFIGDDRPQYNDNNLYVTFRDREWTEVGTFRSRYHAIDEMPYNYKRFYLGDNFPNNESFEVRVEYTADGSTMNVYVQGTLTDSVSGLEAYDELYFSSFQDIAQFIDPEYRLRMTTASTLGDYRSDRIEREVDAPTNFTGEITDLDPDSQYFVTAYGQQRVGNQLITANGTPIATRTESIVETNAPTKITANTTRLRGELTASFGNTTLSFVVMRTDTGSVVTEETAETDVDAPRQFDATVSGLRPETNYTYYARAADTGSTGVPLADTGENVSFTTDTPVVETVDIEPTSSTATVTGELVDLGGLDETDLYVRYWKQQPVTFNGEPANNSDDIIADGQFLTGPDGYTHSTTGYVHDNTPLSPGENRTYEFIGDDRPQYNDNNLYVTFRDREWTEVGTFRSGDDAIEEMPYSRFYLGDNFPNDQPFEVRVEYTADGSTMNIYVQGTLTDSVGGFEEYETLYFSSYQDIAQFIDPEYRLRMITAPTLGEPQSERIERDVTAPTNYTADLDGLDPSTVYVAEAYSSAEVDDRSINASGGRLAETTDAP